MADSWFGTTALPTYGCLVPNEDELKLFPELDNKKVLEIGCGSGHSLKWCGDRGASELWGLDISTTQMKNAERFLRKNGHMAKLFNSPMETAVAYPRIILILYIQFMRLAGQQIYEQHLKHISSYLKNDGVFIFSWDPFMHCVDIMKDKLVFEGSYLNEDVFSYNLHGYPVTIINRKMSTYINTLA